MPAADRSPRIGRGRIRRRRQDEAPDQPGGYAADEKPTAAVDVSGHSASAAERLALTRGTPR
jgi:hypothetical protein